MYCTFQSGVDFQCPIVALTDYGHRVMCTLEQTDDEQVELPLQHPQHEVSTVGCPITAVIKAHGPDSASTIEAEISSTTDTDMEHMMEYPCSDPVLHKASGMAKAQVCPTCGADIFSGLALIRHMQTHHPRV